jgi:hypothetical protein
MDAVAPLANAVTPIRRATGYYARSWRRYLSRAEGAGVPVLRPTPGLAGQAFLDEIVLAGFRVLRPFAGADAFVRIEREVSQAVEMYESAGWCDDPASYHHTPPALSDVTLRTVKGRRQTYVRVSFESEYEPHVDEPGRERYLGYRPNRRARAWMLRHDEPRPWLFAVHGASMGRANMDLALLKARWLHEDLGLNVILPVLPLHGPRRRGLERSETFPGEDILDNVHGAAQAVWDVRRLATWIRADDPEARIGITGISLGGFVTSLVASLEDGLACAIAGVPAVDLVDLLEHHAGLAPDDERRRVLSLAKRVGRVISPLEMEPRVPHEARFVYAGLADRLVHPRRQVIRLWEHWGRPEIEWYPGGHTGFSRSKPVGAFVKQALVRSGLVDR